MRTASLALVVALIGLGGCGDERDPEPEVPAIAYCEPVAAWDPAHAAVEVEVLHAINERRVEGADCGSGGEFESAEPLTMDPALRCASRMHTSVMITDDFFAHETPAGETYAERTDKAGYAGEVLAQTIAAGPSEASQVVATWMTNDGNCAKLMNPEATQLGVGYRPATGVLYPHYWTLLFGR